MKWLKIILTIVAIALLSLIIYLFRPVSGIPDPPEFGCYNLSKGHYIHLDSLPLTNHIYGVGLTYSGHLKETGSSFNKDVPPPLFKKSLSSLCRDGEKVSIPNKNEMLGACNEIEPDLNNLLTEYNEDMSALLDYEVELGMILLEDIKKGNLDNDDFIPKVGYFISNDLSARTIALLGEGKSNKYDYWGISKSFAGFTPVGSQIWVPNKHQKDGLLCTRIETLVNGEIRQSQTTNNMVFTPMDMIKFVSEKYPNNGLNSGDMILTGTPAGVAIATPKALLRLGNLVGMDRFKKLDLKINSDLTPFLKKGDLVEVRGEGLGSVSVQLID